MKMSFLVQVSEDWFLIDEVHANFGLQDDLPEILIKICK